MKALIGKELDFRVRIFNLLLLSGALIGTIMFLGSLVTSSLFVIVINLSAVIFSLFILYYVNHTLKYQQCYFVAIIAIFLIMFPILFFANNGYKGAMLQFFIFAIVFTLFMLEGKQKIIVAVTELLIYTSLCIYAYFNPKSITAYASELDCFMDMMITFVSVAFGLGMTSSLLFGMYDEQKRELEKVKQQLMEENVLLDRVNYLKSEFLGNIAHELKTPLTVISGYAQTACIGLREENKSTETTQQLLLIASEAERLALMVNQLLDITRIEEHNMVIKPIKTSVIELIQTTVSTYYPILKKNNNKLSLRLPYELPPVKADSVRILQVIVNLLTNAIRHTYNGEIVISATKVDDFVEIIVSDTGDGIEPERIPLLFERYKSYDRRKTSYEKETGTGLGLFICKYLIDAHGGKISLESQLKKGTTVRFTLPVY